MKKIVVIGASAASMSFISKLRSFDTESSVICFSGESDLPYNRCLLADVVKEEKYFEDICLKPESFFEEHRVDLRLNSWVTAINTQEKFVECNQQQESYDYLFIGIGSHAFIPSIPGIDLPGVFAFHTFADISKLDNYIADTMPKHVVVVGAGINGVEAASALVQRGLKVTIVDMFDCIMPLHIDQQIARFVEQAMKDAGVHILKGHKVVSLQTRGRQSVGKIQLASGAFLPTDCVVIATGCRPYSQLIVDAGLKHQDGYVIVNQNMQTSDEFVFAGGDICMAPDIISKHNVKSATWSDAMLQGLTAATQLSDTPRVYPGVIGMRDSHFFGFDFYACGQTTDVALYDIVIRHEKDFYHAFYLDEGRLQGFVLVGCIENLSKYKTFYLTQQQVAQEELC